MGCGEGDGVLRIVTVGVGKIAAAVTGTSSAEPSSLTVIPSLVGTDSFTISPCPRPRPVP